MIRTKSMLGAKDLLKYV